MPADPQKFIVAFKDGTYGLVFAYAPYGTYGSIRNVYSLSIRDAIRSQESGVPFVSRQDLTDDEWRAINALSFLS